MIASSRILLTKRTTGASSTSELETSSSVVHFFENLFELARPDQGGQADLTALELLDQTFVIPVDSPATRLGIDPDARGADDDRVPGTQVTIVADQARIDELLDQLVAEPFDVHGAAGCEVEQVLPQLARAGESAGAPRLGLPVGKHDRVVTEGAALGHVPHLGPRRAPVEQRPDWSTLARF